MDFKNLTAKLMQMRKIKPSFQQKLVVSLIALLLLIISPALLNKKPVELAQAQNIAKSQPISPTPTPAPQQTKNAEPSQTPEPVAARETPNQKTGTARPTTNNQNKTTARSNSQASSQQPVANAPSNSTDKSYSQPQTPQPVGILGYINQVRAENGLTGLTYNSLLNSAAMSKSQDMLENNYFAHTSPDGRSDFDFIKAAGYIYSFAGSNIAKGSFTEKTVFDAWMNSSGHRANILDPKAKEFGYGVAGQYFTMMVGAR